MDDNRLIIDNTQTELDAQRPAVQFLTKDKFGGENFQALEIQSNRLSKRLLSSLWLESLVLSSNSLELVAKSIGWFAAGVAVALLAAHSLTTSLFTVPVVLFIVWLLAESMGSHLKFAVLFLVMLFAFGLVLAFVL